MKSQEEYSQVLPDQRQRAVVSDLQRALSSMREAYSRSSEVVANNDTGTTPAAAIQNATARQVETHLAQQLFQEFDSGIAVSIGTSNANDNHDDGSAVDRNWTNVEPESDEQALTAQPRKDPGHRITSNQPNRDRTVGPTAAISHNNIAASISDTSLSKSTTRSSPRRTRGEPVYNLARLTGNQINGKRAASGDDVLPKRQKLSTEPALEVGRDGYAYIVSSPSFVSRHLAAESAHSSQSPSLGTAAGGAESSFHHKLSVEVGAQSDSPSSSTKFPAELSVNDDADDPSAALNSRRGLAGSQEDAARFLNASKDAKKSDDMQKVR